MGRGGGGRGGGGDRRARCQEQDICGLGGGCGTYWWHTHALDKQTTDAAVTPTAKPQQSLHTGYKVPPHCSKPC